MSTNGHEARLPAAPAGPSQPHPPEGEAVRAESLLEGQLRAYLLAEVRRDQCVTQVEIARRLGVGQPRISQIERGDLDRAGLATVRAYIEALGGEMEVSATFGDRRLRIA